jgi:hypothetical protein
MDKVYLIVKDVKFFYNYELKMHTEYIMNYIKISN